MRVMDVILSFPSLVLALSLAARSGAQPAQCHSGRGLRPDSQIRPSGPGEALALREALFIKAARVSGFRAP